jgi:hypothetical protein
MAPAAADRSIDQRVGAEQVVAQVGVQHQRGADQHPDQTAAARGLMLRPVVIAMAAGLHVRKKIPTMPNLKQRPKWKTAENPAGRCLLFPI